MYGFQQIFVSITKNNIIKYCLKYVMKNLSAIYTTFCFSKLLFKCQCILFCCKIINLNNHIHPILYPHYILHRHITQVYYMLNGIHRNSLPFCTVLFCLCTVNCGYKHMLQFLCLHLQLTILKLNFKTFSTKTKFFKNIGMKKILIRRYF